MFWWLIRMLLFDLQRKISSNTNTPTWARQQAEEARKHIQHLPISFFTQMLTIYIQNTFKPFNKYIIIFSRFHIFNNKLNKTYTFQVKGVFIHKRGVDQLILQQIQTPYSQIWSEFRRWFANALPNCMNWINVQIVQCYRFSHPMKDNSWIFASHSIYFRYKNKKQLNLLWTQFGIFIYIRP